MLEVLHSTGIRNVELRRLKLPDVDLVRGCCASRKARTAETA